MKDLERKISEYLLEASLIREFYEAMINIDTGKTQQNWCIEKYGEAANIQRDSRFIKYEQLGTILKEVLEAFPKSEEYPDIEKFIRKQTGLDF